MMAKTEISKIMLSAGDSIVKTMLSTEDSNVNNYALEIAISKGYYLLKTAMSKIMLSTEDSNIKNYAIY